MVVDLAVDKSGAWAGSIIVPGLSIKGVPLKDVVVKGSEISFGLKRSTGGGLEASFKGRFDGNDSLTGDFVQGGNTAPFQLNRIGVAQVETAPRSSAVSSGVEGEWQGEYEMFGYPRKVSLKLKNNGDLGAGAEFVIIGKRVNNLPVDLVTEQNNLVSVYSHESGITIEGRYRKETNEIRGSLTQGPIEVPLILKRKMSDKQSG